MDDDARTVPFRLVTDVEGLLGPFGAPGREEASRMARATFWFEAMDGLLFAVMTVAAIVVPLLLAVTCLSLVRPGHPASVALGLCGSAACVAALAASASWLTRAVSRRATRDALANAMAWDGATVDVSDDRFTVTKAGERRTYRFAIVTAFETSLADGFRSFRVHLLQGHVDVPCVPASALADRFEGMLERQAASAAGA